ncbi:MAG: choice-of-anchor Q domain-containing protein [Rhizonema sp. PD38]|nr:choice-of-anchor Q domain-containing protein [Rhizonema sp. PD38]
MDIPGSTIDDQSALSSQFTPVFSDNVQSLLDVGTIPKNPTAIITVNSTADVVDDHDGVTTLREAINLANADNGRDLVVFDRSVFSNAQTITLTGGELDITHNLDIIAPKDSLTGEDLVTVSGNKASQIVETEPGAPASRVFEIEPGATVTLSGLIIANGRVLLDNAELSRNNYRVAIDNGGGIKNSGILTLDSSVVRNNAIPNVTQNIAGAGGGIYNTGTLTVNNSTISGNSAGLGGGIYNTGTLTLSNSILSNNSLYVRTSAAGGGIYNTGTASVLNSTLNDNIVNADGGSGGGGIFNAGNLQLSTSTLNNNSSRIGGGIENTDKGILSVSNSTLNGNSAYDSGGGISNRGISTVSDSTLSGNSASNSGGGIYNFGTITVSNSTLSGNRASRNSLLGRLNSLNGGGIFNDGILTLVFSNVTLNSATNGSGVYNNPNAALVRTATANGIGTVNVRNTIIASNLLNVNGIDPDVVGDFKSSGYNLIGDFPGSTGFGTTGDIVGTSDNPIDPRLAPNDFYGGDTQTIALLPDSPAIDAADPTILDTDPTTDQRGFPRVINGRADIGAYEFSA